MKMIASDFDGTLRRSHEVTAEDKAAIAKWRGDGNVFGVVTGREISSIKRELIGCGVECDFIAANNGGQIFTGGWRELFGLFTDGAKLERIAKYIYNEGGVICGVAHDGVYDTLFNRDRERENIDVELMNSVSRFGQVNTYFHSDNEARDFIVKFNVIFDGLYSAHQNGNCVDIPPYGVSKATGITKAAEIFGVKKSDIITIGDNFNDLPMIEAFNGAAVENAKDDVKAKASVIVKDFTELIQYFNSKIIA